MNEWVEFLVILGVSASFSFNCVALTSWYLRWSDTRFWRKAMEEELKVKCASEYETIERERQAFQQKCGR